MPCWVGCDIVIILRDKTILISYRRAAVAAETDDRDNDAAVQDGVNVLADAGQIIFNKEIILSDEIFCNQVVFRMVTICSWTNF